MQMHRVKRIATDCFLIGAVFGALGGLLMSGISAGLAPMGSSRGGGVLEFMAVAGLMLGGVLALLGGFIGAITKDKQNPDEYRFAAASLS